MSINTAENVGIHGAMAGFACWNRILSTFSLEECISSPTREGSHFEFLEMVSHLRLITRAIRVIGINVNRSGENWPKILFSFTFIFWALHNQRLRQRRALPQYAEN